jgi:hypothetical protein
MLIAASIILEGILILVAALLLRSPGKLGSYAGMAPVGHFVFCAGRQQQVSEHADPGRAVGRLGLPGRALTRSTP